MTENIKEDRKEISQQKSEKFRQYALDYLEARKEVLTGFQLFEKYAEQKERIKSALGASEEQWQDWKWQLANRISNVEMLGKIFPLTDKQKHDFAIIQSKFRWAFTPYFASIIDPVDDNCPVRKQMLPDIREMEMTGVADFSGEEYSSPVDNLVRWYPDRVAVHVTNVCAGFCRHCLRRRKIGEVDQATPADNLEDILQYLRNNREIRDVLLTGGDPFTFQTEWLDRILTALDEIEHIEIKRIGSRVPIVLPQRVDEELCAMLSRHHPLYVNVQVNHPRELTADSARALDLITRAGIPIHNQSVLLRGINDSAVIIKTLNHELLKVRVRPYYLYHCQGTIGIEHFRTPVETGIEILENLRGYTTGLAIPSYIITPSGLGKTPLAPVYQVSSGDGFVLLRNWEGIVYRYDNPGHSGNE